MSEKIDKLIGTKTISLILKVRTNCLGKTSNSLILLSIWLTQSTKNPATENLFFQFLKFVEIKIFATEII